jgi:ribonuclease E
MYQGEVPLFTHYQIESQIESAFQREVTLPSGGSIVIDPTEALVSIDINSSKATKGSDIEETALNTNLEAAEEISRQLRLRDLGGLLVIDFIDMTPPKHQRDVENRLKDSIKQDRARVQIGKISRFGLLEMSRQRLRPSLGDASQHTCPRCDGQGTVRSNESLALSILRLIEEEAIKDNTAQIQAQVPVPVSSYLLNEKRDSIRHIENNNKVNIMVIPNIHMDTPHYDVVRVRIDEDIADSSFKLVTRPEETELTKEIVPLSKKEIEEPVLKGFASPKAPAPKAVEAETKEPKGPSLVAKAVKWVSSLFAKEEKPKPTPKNRNSNYKGKNENRRGGNQKGRPRNTRPGDKKPHERHDKRDNTRVDQKDTKPRGNQKDTRRNQDDTREARNDNRNDTRTDTRKKPVATQTSQRTTPERKEEHNAERRQRRSNRKRVRVQKSETETQKVEAVVNNTPEVQAPVVDVNTTPVTETVKKTPTSSKRTIRDDSQKSVQQKRQVIANIAKGVKTPAVVEAKPVEAKPVEVKPVEAKSVKAKPAAKKKPKAATSETPSEKTETTTPVVTETPAVEAASVETTNSEVTEAAPEKPKAKAKTAVKAEKPAEVKKEVVAEKPVVAPANHIGFASAPMTKPTPVESVSVGVPTAMADSERTAVVISAKTGGSASATSSATSGTTKTL